MGVAVVRDLAASWEGEDVVKGNEGGAPARSGVFVAASSGLPCASHGGRECRRVSKVSSRLGGLRQRSETETVDGTQ